MKILLSSFNMYKGGSKTIYDNFQPILHKYNEIIEITYQQKNDKRKNRISIKYPISYFNWIYRILIEALLIPLIAYYNNVNKIVLFGNFPSLFWFKKQSIYFHNMLYLDNLNNSIKIKLETLLFIFLIKIKKPEILVQTEFIAKRISDKFNNYKNIKVIGIPYQNKLIILSKTKIKNNKISYFYPAFFYPHKNHKLLFKNETVFKRLNSKVLLTIKNDDPKLITDGITFIFLGNITYEKLITILSESDALIYPSLTESVGLPLIEAAIYKKPIIAPDYEYVNSVVKNFYSFDPKDNQSFIDALIKCHNDIKLNKARIPKNIIIQEPEKFINFLIK